MLEDIVNTGQRPKTEDYGSCLFLVLKMLYRRGQGGPIMVEQVSLLLGGEYGYPAVWAVMLAVGLGMAVFFRRRQWW
jgi:Mg2+ and Co2+ transporter CorA